MAKWCVGLSRHTSRYVKVLEGWASLKIETYSALSNTIQKGGMMVSSILPPFPFFLVFFFIYILFRLQQQCPTSSTTLVVYTTSSFVFLPDLLALSISTRVLRLAFPKHIYVFAASPSSIRVITHSSPTPMSPIDNIHFSSN
jgi:hypothetical protein